MNEVCRKIWSQKAFNKMQRLLTYILFRMPRPWIIEWPKLRLKLIWLVSIELAGETLLLKVSLFCQVTPPRVLVFFSWWNLQRSIWWTSFKRRQSKGRGQKILLILYNGLIMIRFRSAKMNYKVLLIIGSNASQVSKSIISYWLFWVCYWGKVIPGEYITSWINGCQFLWAPSE